MSLQTRLTALAQAVGADIKALSSKVVTASSFSAKAKPSADWPIPAAQTAIPGMSVTVPDAGRYRVAFSSDMTIGPGNGYILAFVAINGVVANGSEAAIKQTYATDPNARFPFNMEWLITANAGDVITVQMSNGGYANNNISALHTSLIVSRPGGIKGDKGDPGYALMAAIGGPVYVNAAAGWNQLPFDAAAVITTTDGTADFTRNASGSITFNKAGTYDISATMGNAAAAQPTTATMDCRLIVGPVGVVNPDTSINALTVERRQAVAGDYTICSLSGQVTVAAGQSLAAWLFVAVAVNGVAVSHFGITRQGGPQGPKGDSGGIAVITTMDWNTALASNFYRSSNDPLNRTAHNPGDTLNPPMTAGIVTAHENGSLTQRVWDLDYQAGYTRYRDSDGAWSAWIPEVTKPGVYAGMMVGGATPQDGDERYFQNAAMKAAGIMWKFRYDKTAPAGQPKWVFVGGSDWWASESAATVVDTNAYGLFNGPQIAIPLAGDYMLRYGAAMGMAAGENGYYTVLAVAGGASDADAVNAYSSLGNPYTNAMRQRPFTIASGFNLQGVSRVSGASRVFSARWLSVTPIRVTM